MDLNEFYLISDDLETPPEAPKAERFPEAPKASPETATNRRGFEK